MTAHKYHAVSVEEDGYRFASKAEHRRYRELKLLVAAGAISDLEVHPKFPLTINGTNVGRYEADFGYRDLERNEVVFEDVKGVRTEVYKLKAKLVRALYGVEIVEVPA